MIITCEACNTSFNLDDKMLKPTGSKVRCSVCAKIFTAFPQPVPASEPKDLPDEPEPVLPTDPKPDLPAAAAMVAAESESLPEADTADAPAPETDVLEEDAGDLFAEGSDLDFALDDEPEDAVASSEIEDAVSDALEEDMADLASIDDESDATVIASLDDDDFNLDPSPDQEDEDATATVIANLDDDLDFSLDDQPDVAETVIADLDQDDFDLNVPAAIDGDAEGTATVIANLDDDTFDLDDDFSLEPGEEDASGVPADVSGPETMADLDELNLTLDMEPVDETPQDDAAVLESDDQALDDLALDFDIESDDELAETPTTEDKTEAPNEDLELSLDMDDKGPADVDAVADTPVLEDDLDLSSLESLLDDDAEGDDDSVTMAVDDAEDLELSLDLDDVTPVAEADAAEETGEALEDLDFDLDGEGQTESIDLGDADDADQEIDLSEIEKMLEEPEQASAKFSSVPDQDLDLDIEASLETEKWMSESGDDDQLVMDEELDLSELEQALDDVDTNADDDTPEDAELELELGEGDALGTATETVAIDNDLDFDLSDFEDGPTHKPADEKALHESADMELEFEVEEDRKVEQTLEDEGLEETVAIPEPTAKKMEAAPPEPADLAPETPTPKPVKKGVSKSLVFLLIIAILGGGGYGTYYMLNQNGIEIPYLSDYLKPKVNDPGNLKLTTYDINSKFVDNASVGKLFVISGKVKNGYAENRGMVTLAGNIFSTGKVPVNKEKVYCGNIMSDLELANLEWDKIKARLSNRLGDNRSNVKIEPGKSIPFMVVFSDLPEDLEEFTIEVTGSTSLK